jgi:4-amino-4-deoxy-L-arabinose transferase-like glycosyltransferase
MENNYKSKKIFFLILLLIAYHIVTNFIWIANSTAPLPWDQAGHTRLAIQFADYFKTLGFLRIIDYFTISTYYPPLIHTIVGLFIVFFGHPVQMGEITVTVFFAISIFLVYIYALDLFKRSSIALISAIAFSFCPIVFELSRWFLLEIPLLAFLLASFICLNRSKTFSDSKYTKYFFIFAALAVITKWLALVYLAFPTALVLFKWLKIRSEYSKENLLRYSGVFLLISIPWYAMNLINLINQALPNLQGESSDPSHILSFQNFIFYIYILINFQLTLFLAIIFIIGAGYFFLKSKSEHKLLIGGFILFIYLVFSFISNKDWRYTMPILPFAAMIIGFCLIKLRDNFRIVGNVAILLTILFLISYHLLLSFRPLNFHYQRAIDFPVIGWIDYVNINDNLAHAYNNTQWPQNEILLSIPNNEKSLILCLVDQERFNYGDLSLERDLLGLKEIDVETPPSTVFSNQQEIQNYLSNFSYAVITNRDIVNPATRNGAVFMQLKNYIQNQNMEFTKIKSYTLPNGDILDLYQRKTQ